MKMPAVWFQVSCKHWLRKSMLSKCLQTCPALVSTTCLTGSVVSLLAPKHELNTPIVNSSILTSLQSIWFSSRTINTCKNKQAITSTGNYSHTVGCTEFFFHSAFKHFTATAVSLGKHSTLSATKHSPLYQCFLGLNQ